MQWRWRSSGRRAQQAEIINGILVLTARIMATLIIISKMARAVKNRIHKMTKRKMKRSKIVKKGMTQMKKLMMNRCAMSSKTQATIKVSLTAMIVYHSSFEGY